MLGSAESGEATKQLSFFRSGRTHHGVAHQGLSGCGGWFLFTQDLGSLAPVMPRDSYTEEGEKAASELLEQEAPRRRS